MECSYDFGKGGYHWASGLTYNSLKVIVLLDMAINKLATMYSQPVQNGNERSLLRLLVLAELLLNILL